MKLRLYRNTLRFRLSPADVEALLESGAAEERTRFSAATELCYRLVLSADVRQMRAVLTGAGVTVYVPRQVAESWGRGSEVGMRHRQTVDHESTLEILIEKDFECIDQPQQHNGHDEKMYPNPNKVCN